MSFPKSIQNLINYFSKLPTVGPKTAERYVFYLLKQNQEELNNFGKAVQNLKKDIKICKICNAVSEQNPCLICTDPRRDKSIICVVANTRDMQAIESIKTANWTYHVLGGVIDTLNNIAPSQLNVKNLLVRLKQNKISEVILALNPNLEGETTCLYLAKLFKPYKIKITRLARGLPTGADLEYADEITLENALKYRNEIK